MNNEQRKKTANKNITLSLYVENYDLDIRAEILMKN